LQRKWLYVTVFSSKFAIFKFVKEIRLHKKSLAALMVVLLLVLSVHLLLRSDFFLDRLTRFTASKIKQLTGGQATLDRARLSLASGTLILDGIVIPASETGRSPMTVKQVRVTVSPWSLLTQVTFIKRIRLIGPEVILRVGDGPLLPFQPNLSKNPTGSTTDEPKKSGVVIREIEFQDGLLSIQGSSGKAFLTLNGLGGTIVPSLLMENFKAILSAKKIEVDQNDFHETFDSMSAQFTFQSHSVEIRKLEVRNAVSRYTITGTVEDPSRPRLALSIDAQFPLQEFNSVWPGRFPMSGRARFTGEITGEGSDPTVRGNISVADWTVATKPVGRLKTLFQYRDRSISFSEISAAVSGGQLSGDVRMSFPKPAASRGTVPFGLTVQFTDLDPSAFLPIFGIDDYPSRQRLEGALEIEGRIQGMRIDPADLTGNGRLHLVQKANPPSASSSEDLPSEHERLPIRVLDRLQDASTHFGLDHGTVSLDNTSARTAQSSVTVEGRILWNGPLSLDITMESGQISEIAAFTPLHSIDGKIKLTGKLTGTWNDPVFQGAARAQDLRLRDRPFETAESDLRYQNRSIRFKQAVFRQQGALYRIGGSVTFESSEDGRTVPYFDIAAKIRQGSAQDVIAIFTKELPITTPATGDLTAKGIPKRFRLITRLQAGPGSIYGQRVDEGTVALVVTEEGIVFQEARAKRGETIVSGKGVIHFKGDYEFSAETTQARLEDFQPPGQYPSDLKGPLTARIGGRGSFRDPQLEARISLLNIAYRDQTLGPGTVSLQFKNHRITADLRMTRGISGAGEIALEPGHPYQVVLTLTDLDLKPWLGSAVPNLTAVTRFTTSGTLTAKGRLDPPAGAEKGLLDDSEATIRLTELQIEVSDYAVTNDGDIQLELQKGRVSIQALRFKGPGTTLTASGDLILLKSYNFFINGEADLDLFRIFTKEITYGKGLAYLALQVTDRWEDPKIRGGLTIHDGMIKIASLNQTLTITSVGFSFNERQVFLESLEAELGDGRIQASGRIDMDRFIPASFGLDLEITGGRISPVSGLTALFNASLFFQGDTKARSLTGEIEILRATYDRRLDWQAWVIEFLKPEKREESRSLPWLHDTALNIQIRGKENIWINNNLAKLPLEIDLILKGTMDRPVLLGRVEAKSGSFTFRRNDFKLVSGTLDFINPEKIRPIIDVRATTTISSYDIELTMVGPIDKFDLGLSSNPPLKDENEILCLLTFRRPCKEVETTSKEIGTAEASALVTAEIQGIITDKVEAITGIDRIQVDPYYSSTKAGSGPMVTVSKRLLEDNLYVTYATTLDPSQEQIIQMEYEINKNVSLIGQRDELGRAGADLKFHFEFR
jgi:TamB, inner membrane protein subunit of TAM complex